MTPDTLRHGGVAALDAALAAQRALTLRLFDAERAALGEAMDVRYLETINPPRWELGHVAWFEEFWLARNTERLRGAAARLDAPRAASLLADADALYDSSTVAHSKRWHLDLPDASRTRTYAARVRERTRVLLQASRENADALYFFRLVLAHEAMHHEAGAMIAQTLALPVTEALPTAAPRAQGEAGEIAVAGRVLAVGRDDGGFAFDNELGSHEVAVADFRIDRTPVTWRAYLPFIEAGGYDDARWWTHEGLAWRRRELANGLPKHLRRDDDGTWERAAFGRWQPLDLDQPAMHLSAHETAAWCRWAGRRLPSEHEWMLAAEHADFAWGDVWEWTASPFAPFPGFVRHPYRDYSAPWFDGRPVLKGGSFASAPFMKHARYRNFFQPERNDVFAGFRSCAT
ncbi:MAG TPA: selenoneine synthase SenA [Burkholderiaceae bacterium]|nr:selenoneine synthase SenA [Burkholderiaceae bacterium]